MKTLYILGAGASKYFNFPLGDELKREIVILLKDYKSNKLNKYQLADFRDRLGSSGLTIDTFLTENEEYKEFGKKLIEGVIKQRLDKFNPNKVVGSYYQTLFNSLPMTKEKIDFSRISILDFNYDLVVRKAFELSFLLRFGKEKKNVETFNNEFGKLSYETIYGNIDEGIRIWSEKSPDVKVSNNIVQFISNANAIVFLGFGYHLTNLKLLFGNSPKQLTKDKLIIGTMMSENIGIKSNVLSFFGRNGGAIENLVNRPKSEEDYSSNLYFVKTSCDEYFKNYTSVEQRPFR